MYFYYLCKKIVPYKKLLPLLLHFKQGSLSSFLEAVFETWELTKVTLVTYSCFLYLSLISHAALFAVAAVVARRV